MEVSSRPLLFLSLLYLDALESFKVKLLMSHLQWSVSLHILKYLVPMVLKIYCDWELFQCKVLIKVQHVSRPDLNKDCIILQIVLKVWQFSWAYNVTFHWSLIIDLKIKNLSCFMKNNSDLYQVQSIFEVGYSGMCCYLAFFPSFFSRSDSKKQWHLFQPVFWAMPFLFVSPSFITVR